MVIVSLTDGLMDRYCVCTVGHYAHCDCQPEYWAIRNFAYFNGLVLLPILCVVVTILIIAIFVVRGKNRPKCPNCRVRLTSERFQVTNSD